MNNTGKKVLFLDRDGTLILEPDDQQVDALEKVRLVDNVIPALCELRDAGFTFVMVTNQDGLGTESFPQADFERCQKLVLDIFSSQGIQFEQVLICPHLQSDNCSCRKPRTGLLTRYLAGTSLDTTASAVIGDRNTDLEFAENIGIRGFKIDPAATDGQTWRTISATLRNRARTATVARKTRETDIEVTVRLDDSDTIDVATGIGFLDHMLEQIAKHGGFSLSVSCSGDLEVDEHHTVEDTAICLGTALRDALGDKRGIGRYGFLLPMDESEARIALDLSGRAAFQFSSELKRESVGGLPTELVPHFLPLTRRIARRSVAHYGERRE